MRELAELAVATVPGSASGMGSGEPDPQEGGLARYDRSSAREQLGWEPTIGLASGIADWRRRLQQEAVR